MTNQSVIRKWYGNAMPAFSGIDCKKCGKPREKLSYAGRQRWRCRPCDNAAGATSRKAYYQANKERWQEYGEKRVQSGKHFDAYLRRTYGITAERYDEMFTAQSGVCAICSRPESRKIGKRSLRGDEQAAPLCVDHNHQTGAVRALLCHACNTLIGHARESAQTLRRSAEYLESYLE